MGAPAYEWLSLVKIPGVDEGIGFTFVGSTVTEIVSRGPAWRAGLRTGDRILDFTLHPETRNTSGRISSKTIHRWLPDVYDIIQAMPAGQVVALRVVPSEVPSVRASARTRFIGRNARANPEDMFHSMVMTYDRQMLETLPMDVHQGQLPPRQVTPHSESVRARSPKRTYDDNQDNQAEGRVPAIHIPPPDESQWRPSEETGSSKARKTDHPSYAGKTIRPKPGLDLEDYNSLREDIMKETMTKVKEMVTESNEALASQLTKMASQIQFMANTIAEMKATDPNANPDVDFSQEVDDEESNPDVDFSQEVDDEESNPDVDFSQEVDDEESVKPKLVNKSMHWLAQVGGTSTSVTVGSNWVSRLRNEHKLNDEMIRLFTVSSMITFPASVVTVADPYFYTTIIAEGRKPRSPLSSMVVCIPACEQSHWVLTACVISPDDIVTFAFDSLADAREGKWTGGSTTGRDVTAKVAQFIGGVFPGRNVSTYHHATAKQTNDTDCGIFTIDIVSQLSCLLEKLAKTKQLNPPSIIKEIERRSFVKGTIVTRASIGGLLQKVCFISSELDLITTIRVVDGQRIQWPGRKVPAFFAARVRGTYRPRSGDVPFVWIGDFDGIHYAHPLEVHDFDPDDLQVHLDALEGSTETQVKLRAAWESACLFV